MSKQPGERDEHGREDRDRKDRACDRDAAEVFGDVGDRRVLSAVWGLREIARSEGALQGAKLRQIARLASRAEAAARRMLAASRRVSSRPDDTVVIDTAVTGELMAALGIAAGPAGDLLALARRLTRVLPGALTAIEDGRLDLPRARVLAEETRVLTDEQAREVAADLLANAGDTPWDGPSPRAWRERVLRAVVKADPDGARRRLAEAIAERAVRTWLNGDGTGTLWLRTADVDIRLADEVITALALAWPSHGPDGQPLTMAQRRVEALIDVFRRLRDGEPLPESARRARGTGPGRDVGIVLPADTLFGDGPAAADPGQLHGMGTPSPVDPRTARETAESDIAAGAAARVFLTDPSGALIRLVRLMLADDQQRWTRESLTSAVRAALPGLPALRTDRYSPTEAIVEHVRARNPHCMSYDCPRTARRCDLDHDEPWPRGPTDAANLGPRCRRDHETKTRGLVHTSLSPDGTLITRMLSGLEVTTRPAPLPGYGPGEGYDRSESRPA